MAKEGQQKKLEREVIEAEAEWKQWLLTMFGAEDDPRHVKTVELLDKKLDAANMGLPIPFNTRQPIHYARTCGVGSR